MSIDLLRSPGVFLNLNVRGMGESAALAINERSHRLAAQGRPVCRLGLGQSPFPVPDHVRESLKSTRRWTFTLLHCRRVLAALFEQAFQTLSDAGAVLSQPNGGFYPKTAVDRYVPRSSH